MLLCCVGPLKMLIFKLTPEVKQRSEVYRIDPYSFCVTLMDERFIHRGHSQLNSNIVLTRVRCLVVVEVTNAESPVGRSMDFKYNLKVMMHKSYDPEADHVYTQKGS